MKKTSSINIRIEPNAKSQVEDLYNSLGITLSDAIKMFIYQSIQLGGLPFTPRVIQPNATTKMAMQESKDIAESHNARFSTAEEMFDDLGI